MRRTWLLSLLCSLAFCLSYHSPSLAQENVLLEAVEARAELSTLQRFLDSASPSFVSRLGQEDLTLFAPTNTAFNNFASFFNLSLPTLLENEALVTELLLYHTIPMAYSTQTIGSLDGRLVETLRSGEYISFQLTADGLVSLNNLVEVIETDVVTGAQVMHIVNDVVFTRQIADALRDPANFAVPTLVPRPTTTPTPILQATPSPVPTRTVEPIMVAVRFANLTADLASIDIWINGSRSIRDLSQGNWSPFFTIRAGDYDIAISEAGSATAEALIEPQRITLRAEAAHTIPVIGSLIDVTLRVDPIEENITPVEEAAAQITFYHAAEDVPALRIISESHAAFSNAEINYRGLVTTTQTPFTDQVRFMTSGADARLLAEETIETRAESAYFIALYGRSGEEALAIQTMMPAQLADLRALTGLPRLAPLPLSATNNLDIVDTLAEIGDFATLLLAIESARPIVEERLRAQSLDDVTFFAPTDEAFANLLADAGLTRGQLLSDDELLTSILLYHIVESSVTSAELRAQAGLSVTTNLPPLEAFTVRLTRQGALIFNGVVQIVQPDLRANNGVIHVIDDVLLPQSAIAALGL